MFTRSQDALVSLDATVVQVGYFPSECVELIADKRSSSKLGPQPSSTPKPCRYYPLPLSFVGHVLCP